MVDTHDKLGVYFIAGQKSVCPHCGCILSIIRKEASIQMFVALRTFVSRIVVVTS